MVDRQTREIGIQHKQNTEMYVEDQRIKLALIPTGEHYRSSYSVETLKTKGGDTVDFYLPTKDGELISADKMPSKDIIYQDINWGYASTYSPKIRAEMLYDAIFNKKFDYINITGGRGNEYTIIELDRLIRERQPKIDKIPIVYGMSDATNLLNYLGQNGIARSYISTDIMPPYLLRNLDETVRDMRERKIRTNDNLNVVVDGVLVPEYLLRSYGTIQEMKLFKNKVNFLATEIHSLGEAKLMMDAYGSIADEDKKNIVFCLSAVGETEEISTKDYKEKYNLLNEPSDSELKCCIAHNRIKQKEQNEFKQWCSQNGFRVIEDISFGHHNTPSQYLPIPTYHYCRLDGNTLKYSLIPEPLDEFMEIKITQHDGEVYSTLEFDKNYIPGGSSDVSTFITKDSKGNAITSTIFSQARNLRPNDQGEFNIIFDSFEDRSEYAHPSSIYLQDLERVLKDIDRLKIDGLKTIKITGFDLPLSAKVDSGYRRNKDKAIYFNSDKENKTNKEAIIEVVSYISKNYENLRNVRIELSNMDLNLEMA